jgi:hypothetical protein
VSDDNADLVRRLARLDEEGFGLDPDEHPSSERLSAYQANKLSPQEDDALQEHLANCSLCAERLLGLQQFLAAPAEEAGAADFETAAEWRKLWDRIPNAEKKAVSAAIRKEGRGWNLILSPLAASLVLGLLLIPLLGAIWWAAGLRQQAADLRRQVAELRQPQVNVPVLELQAGRGEGYRIPFGKTRDLVLRTSTPIEYDRYTMEITTEDGRPLWSGVLNKDDRGRLTFRLVGGLLNPGLYRIRLLGSREGRVTLIESYPVRVLPTGRLGAPPSRSVKVH